ncbi:MAG: hypothetical protein Kilf2KO_45590 [Rhodospirillales bacterium]
MTAAMGLRTASAFVALVMVSGCLGDAGSGKYSQTATSAVDATSYSVVAGDTLWGIARSKGIPLQSLIEANGLSEPYLLQVGQQLRLPAQALPPATAVAAVTPAVAPVVQQPGTPQPPSTGAPADLSAGAIPTASTDFGVVPVAAAPTVQPALPPGTQPLAEPASLTPDGAATTSVTPAVVTPAVTTSGALGRAGELASRRYQVQPGDTLYAVSRQTGLPVASLAEANGMTAPYALQVGQVLTLPEQPRAASLLQNAALQPAGLDTQATTATGAVVAGTAATAALAATGTTAAAAPAQLGAAAGTPGVTQAVATAPASGGASGLAQPPAKPQREVALPLPPPPTAAAAAASAASASAALPAPPKRQGRLFDWPVTGKVISGYGPKKGGLRNDGVNIAAPAGPPVRAAESGVVAYAGGDLKGFGKLVLIKHQDGYVTAYAHNSQILVRRGETVRRGDVIARVGETGNVDTPQLHFEIRKDASPVDPTGLMVGVAG